MKKKVLSLFLASTMVVSLAACGGGGNDADVEIEVETQEPSNETVAEDEVEYVRADEEEVYGGVLGDYEALLDAADAKSDPNERYVLYAQAEAALLASATMLPDTTQGGNYQISRVAPRTIPYVQWGNDDDRLHSLVVSDEFVTKEERAELMEMWEKARSGEGEYDPAGYLTEKGHTIQKDYVTTFQTAPVTIDWLNTSSQADTEVTVNCVDGLVEYDNLGILNPALAESWDVSEDGTVYTFHLRKDAKWYTSEGTEYAPVTAGDFVAGFRHMLDAKAGLESLVDGLIVGATDYYNNGGSWDAVGYKALDDNTLEVTLEKPTSYFLTMLTYSIFLPMCDSFYQSRGGVYGVEEYAAASADESAYTFGKNTDVASQVYCGPFLLQKLDASSEIIVKRNENYYNNDKTTLDSVRWVFDNGEDLVAHYNDTVAGVYAITSLGDEARRKLAEADGNFEKYAFVADTTSTTYFGGLNLNRGTYALESGAVASPQTEEQKISTHTAMQNINFRKAILFALDKEAKNAVTRGDTALTNLRNMYTHPEFVSLTADITDGDGYTFPAGTFYGDMVQHYVDELGFPIDVHDGVNGWYNPDYAKECLATAMEELGDTVTYPINIDIVYYSANDSNTGAAAVAKETIEANLGAENVQVNLVEATTSEDFYASGYRATTGEAGNFDLFYGSGWGPDYGDPKSYLDTFKGEGAGYMTKVIGLF